MVNAASLFSLTQKLKTGRSNFPKICCPAAQVVAVYQLFLITPISLLVKI